MPAPRELAPAPEPRPRASAAEHFYRNLVDTIEEFQGALSADESAVAIHVTPDGEPLQIHTVTYRPPNIVTFEGLDSEGQKALAIVHVESAALTLKALPKEDDESEARRIGFRTGITRRAAPDAPSAPSPASASPLPET